MFKAVFRRTATAAGASLILAPAAAVGCPLCYESLGPRVLNAYYLSTALLSLLPFTIAGTIAFVAFRMVRRAREWEHGSDAEAPAAPTAPR